MKIDLHIHSKHSKRPSQWILQKLGCPESFTEPMQLYRVAREKGMSLVTITDHNTIDGCLEIAELQDTFISEEVTTYFPEDGCKVHVLVYDIDLGIHHEIQKIRKSIYDLVKYLESNGIFHAVAHPLFSINDRLTIDHFEKLLLLFKNFEQNGARSADQNKTLAWVLSFLDQDEVKRLAGKHGIVPSSPEPWRKNLIGGSDDHSSLNIARTHTEVERAATLHEFMKGIEEGRGKVAGRSSSPLTLAHNLYGIAYQFYKNRLDLDRHIRRDPFLHFLDRFLHNGPEREGGLMNRIHTFWRHRKPGRFRAENTWAIQDSLRHEMGKLMWEDPDFRQIARSENGDGNRTAQNWFRFVNGVCNNVLRQFADHLFEHLSGANLFNIFHSIGSAGALYALLGPYFLSYSLFSKDRAFTQDLQEVLAKEKTMDSNPPRAMKVGHFTDTYHEVNGVALTLQQQVRLASKSHKDLRVITCEALSDQEAPGVRNFRPVGVCDLPEYPELKLAYPPFLEMLNYCYEEGFTHIHSATPGPVGLAALAIARILRLPISGTYHTALPQYAWHLTGDGNVQDVVWRFTVWYYDQLDVIYVPSRSTERELTQKGISNEKIRIFPRGVNLERFHPAKRNVVQLMGRFQLNRALRLLYVGRVSKEKNLSLLARAFRSLLETGADVQLVVVGDGPYLGELKEELAGTPTTFTGYLEGDELAMVYASCDLFVFPSTTDTFGNVVLEAQASGVPVIVTDMGGPQENVLPDMTGIVIQGDSEEALLNGLLSLVGNPDRLRTMGHAARSYMEERSFGHAFDETWAMYERSREAPQSPRPYAKAS